MLLMHPASRFASWNEHALLLAEQPVSLLFFQVCQEYTTSISLRSLTAHISLQYSDAVLL